MKLATVWKTMKTHLFVLCVILLVGVFGITACGKNKKGENVPTTSAVTVVPVTKTVTNTPTPSPDPDKGGWLDKAPFYPNDESGIIWASIDYVGIGEDGRLKIILTGEGPAFENMGAQTGEENKNLLIVKAIFRSGEEYEAVEEVLETGQITFLFDVTEIPFKVSVGSRLNPHMSFGRMIQFGK